MLELDALRQVLYQKAITVTEANGFLCQIGSEPFTQPSDDQLFGQFWFKTGKSLSVELGGPHAMECTAGILQFTIYAPEASGDGPSMKLGGILKHAFNKKTWLVPPHGYVTTDPMSVATIPGVRNGRIVTIADASFDFYHYDPEATVA